MNNENPWLLTYRPDIFIDERGYERNKDDNRLVHRNVAYECLYDPNEYLLPFGHYIIHHVDGNKLNNHPDNLMILTPDEHSKIHGFEPTGFGKYEPQSKSGCFIATAAYGTPFAEEINILRFWRDNYLKTKIFGVFFIKFYYWFSPPIADIIRTSDLLKMATRMCLHPIVKILKKKYNYVIINNIFH